MPGANLTKRKRFTPPLCCNTIGFKWGRGINIRYCKGVQVSGTYRRNVLFFPRCSSVIIPFVVVRVSFVNRICDGLACLCTSRISEELKESAGCPRVTYPGFQVGVTYRQRQTDVAVQVVTATQQITYGFVKIRRFKQCVKCTQGTGTAQITPVYLLQSVCIVEPSTRITDLSVLGIQRIYHQAKITNNPFSL